MAVEITISRVTVKMQHLLARNEIMYLPTLRTKINRSIKFLEKCLKFLKDGQGSTSTINVWKTELLEALYLTEDAIDSFLVRMALTKASPILYLTSLSGQIFLNNKMENIVCQLRQLSDQIQKMSGTSDDMGDSLVENLGDSQLQRSSSKDTGEDPFEPNIPDGRPDKEKAKPSEDTGVPSRNNLGDSQLGRSAKLKNFDENTSESNRSNERPAQEQAKLSEVTRVQPTDLSSKNLGASQLPQPVIKEVGEITSEPNISDERPDQQHAKIPPTDLSSLVGDAELESKDVKDTSEQKITEDMGAPPTGMSSWKDLKVPISEINTSSLTKIASRKRFQRLETFSYLDGETKIVGLQDKLQELAQLTSNRYAMYSIISVVGRAGSGKTLLVRQIFYQSQTRQNFDKLAFISVSQNFKEREVLAEILQQVAGVKDQEKLSFKVLQEKLHDFLAKKRYLIVLDDVHTPDVWNKIKLAFPPNSLKAKGSRVILTIRDAKVARRIAPSIVLLHLRPLTDDESWILFSRSVKKDISTLQENLKREILDKCQGLPLQILVLGGVLASREFNHVEWSKVLKQIKVTGKEEKKRGEETKQKRKETVTVQHGEVTAGKPVGKRKHEEKKVIDGAKDENQSISANQSVSEDILDPSNIFTLGFSDLSPALRACLNYFCFFPKSYQINTRRLFRLWIAEGFAMQLEGEKKAN